MHTALTLALPHPGSEEGARPRGPLARLKRRAFRLVGRALADTSNLFFPTPLGRWLHGRLFAGLEVRVVDVALPGPARAWPTIAFLSDLHAGHFMTSADVAGLVGLLDALRPDVFCLGGDLINHRDAELALLDPALARMRAPLGVFAVPGNHDYVRTGDIEAWRARLEARGVHVLLNRGMRVTHAGASFWFCGVDDLTEGTPRLADALAGRRAGEPALLLSHHPDLFVAASARGVELQLSGHTHGGQIRILGWSPIHHSRHGWTGGLYERGDARLYVGRGAGVTALPIRYGTRSEITLLRPRSGTTAQPAP